MKPLITFSTKSYQATTHPTAILKIESTLNASAAAGLFLQVHDAASTPADTAVPLKSWPATEAVYKEFKNGELHLTQGLYICLSSTSATKTLAAGGSDVCDVLAVELTDPEQPTGTTIVGDLTTPRNTLQVWAEAAGPKKLLRLEVDGSGLGADAYIQLFAKDTINEGDKPILGGQFKIKAGQALTGSNALKFGAGRDILCICSDGEHKGLTVMVNSTSGYYDPFGLQNVKIRAEYK